MCHESKQQFSSEVRLLRLSKAKKESKVRSYHQLIKPVSKEESGLAFEIFDALLW